MAQGRAMSTELRCSHRRKPFHERYAKAISSSTGIARGANGRPKQGSRRTGNRPEVLGVFGGELWQIATLREGAYSAPGFRGGRRPSREEPYV